MRMLGFRRLIVSKRPRSFLHGAVQLKEDLKEVVVRNAMLGAGCPVHSSHVYSDSVVEVMRSAGRSILIQDALLLNAHQKGVINDAFEA